MQPKKHDVPPSAIPRPSKNFGNPLQYGVFHTLLRFGGTHITRLILAFVVTWYTVLPHGRRRALPYLQRRFGALSFPGQLAQCWKLQHSFGTILLERLILRMTGKGGVVYSPDAGAELHRQMGRGKGLIILSAHVGGWQGGLSGLGFLDRPVNILQYKSLRHGDQSYFSHAIQVPVRVIDSNAPFGGLIDAHAALQRNELVCLMGDRLVSPAEPQVPINFLGGTVRFPATAYHLAALAGAPVAVIFIVRGNYTPENSPHQGGSNLHLHLACVLDPPARTQRGGANYIAAAQNFASELEQFVQRHPYQFFNFYDMWDQEKTT